MSGAQMLEMDDDSVRYPRITVNPNQMGGVPCIRGIRVPVATVLGMLGGGMTEEEILEYYPYLEREDIRAALLFAADVVRTPASPLTWRQRRSDSRPVRCM